MTIDYIIETKSFSHDFQPIYQIQHDQCIGYEALFRSIDYHNPELAFRAAKRSGRLYDLDTASIEKAIITFSQKNTVKNDQLLFVNVLPSTLINRQFPNFINHLLDVSQFNPRQLVIEITESEQMELLQNSYLGIESLKERGVRFALDDVGKGYSNFDVMLTFSFDFIKLDRFFSADLSQSPKKKAFIHFLHEYCQNQKINLILEGLEEKQDHGWASDLGIQYGQGYFLGRPGAIESFY